MRWRVMIWTVSAALLAACEGATDPRVPDLRVPRVTLEARGDTVSLAALSDGVVAVSEWESLDPSVVTVTRGGLARAVAAGTAQVRASFGGAEAMGTVTVLPPVDIRVSELAVVTDPGGKLGMGMRIRNEGGRGYYRLEFWKHHPPGTRRRILFYGTDTEAPAGMDIVHRNFLGDELADWVVAYSREPLAQEPQRTSCVRLDGQGEPCPSDLPDPPPAAVDSVAVSPGAAVLNVGDTIRYQVRAFSNGVELTGRPVVWSTPSPDVISLTGTGVAVALKPGYGQVNATVEGVTSAVGLTVASGDPGQPEAPVSFIQLTPRTFRLWVGQGAGVQATAYDAGWRALGGRPFSWAVQDSAVATVDSTGFLRGVGQGRTRVLAASEGVTGSAVVESYLQPQGAADLTFYGLISAAVDPSTVIPSIPTTWTDSAGIVHNAWIQVESGSLDLKWGDNTGEYRQRLVLSTYIYLDPGVQKVAETEYVDEGTLERWWDYAYGKEYFDFTSTVTPGLTYRATWTLPGELAVEQTVGSLAKRGYYFRLDL